MSPERSLAHLRSISSEIRDAVVLDPAGRRLAGSRTLAGPAADLLRQAGDVRMPDAASPQAQALIDVAGGMVDAVAVAPDGKNSQRA